MTSPTTTSAPNPADNQHAIHPLLKSRWSPRIFSNEPIGEEHVKQLFEAARWAASSYNQQPWRFLYAHNGTEAYDKILDCLVEFNQQWAKFAPLLIVTAYEKKFDSGQDNFHALHDLGLALGNLTVQAEELGIALHHMAGFDRDKTKEVFNTPDSVHLTSVIAVGYYGGDTNDLPEDLQGQEKRVRVRKPQSEIAFKNEWPA